MSRCTFVLFQLSGREANAMGRKFIVFQRCVSEIYKPVIEKSPIVFRTGIVLGEGQTTLSPLSKRCNHSEGC